MHSALATFNVTIASARSLTGLYDYLVAHVQSPFFYDEILRAQIVYSVSAFDKLIHDLIRVGMVAIFGGTRPPTPKYHSELISIEVHSALVSATLPPKEHVFEQEIVRKLKLLSFQDPAKVADGLSLIWAEDQKWQKISASLGMDQNVAKTRLKLIAMRRNAIVHESDIDPLSGVKTPISRTECTDITDFLDRCGNAIVPLVA